MVTFLACEEIEFPAADPDRNEKANFDRNIKELIRSIGSTHLRQNFILSLNQGFLPYFFSMPDESGEKVRAVPYPYPVQTKKRIHGTNDALPTDCGLRWLHANDDHRHIMQFVSELAIAVSRGQFTRSRHIRTRSTPKPTHTSFSPAREVNGTRQIDVLRRPLRRIRRRERLLMHAATKLCRCDHIEAALEPCYCSGKSPNSFGSRPPCERQLEPYAFGEITSDVDCSVASTRIASRSLYRLLTAS